MGTRGRHVAPALALAMLVGCGQRRRPGVGAIPTQDFRVPVLGSKDAAWMTLRVLMPDGFEAGDNRLGLAVLRESDGKPLFAVTAHACAHDRHGDACLDAHEDDGPAEPDSTRERPHPGLMRITTATFETLLVYEARRDAVVTCSLMTDRPDVELARRACAELVFP